MGAEISRAHAARVSAYKRSDHSGAAAVKVAGSRPAAENSEGQSGGPEAPRGGSCSGGVRLKNRRRAPGSKHTLIMPGVSGGGSPRGTVSAEVEKMGGAISPGAL